MIKMKDIDLDFMRDILDAVEMKKDCENIYQAYCSNYNQIFESINNECKDFYIQDGLEYDVSENKFLHSTQKEIAK